VRTIDDCKPEKYDYTTFDKFRDRTVAHCCSVDADNESNITSARIKKYAKPLQNCSVLQLGLDEQWWNAFRQHPHPGYNEQRAVQARGIGLVPKSVAWRRQAKPSNINTAVLLDRQ